MTTVRAFISYSHKDDDLLTQLHEHLAALRRQGLIETWTDRKIPAGGVIDAHVDAEVDSAELYLLLVTSAFIDSNYCMDREFLRALKRHEMGQAIIVPIIARECDWDIPELRKFKALPKDGKPIISRYWHTPDEGFRNVAEGIRSLILDPAGFAGADTPPNGKQKKEKFQPDERHVTVEQRAELNRLCAEVVDRLTVRYAKGPEDAAKNAKGRSFGIVWSQFHDEFGTKDCGLPSLLREHFDQAKQWFLQYRASKDKNYKREDPQKYRNTLTKAINTIAAKLGWSRLELHAFAAQKVGYERPVESLRDLGNNQLEIVRQRIRYEDTKRRVRAGQAKALRQPRLAKPALPVARQLLEMILANPDPQQRGLTLILQDSPDGPLEMCFFPSTGAADAAHSVKKSILRPAVEELLQLGYLQPPETDAEHSVQVYELAQRAARATDV